MGKKGAEARLNYQEYYTDSEEDRDVYHNRPDCPSGGIIEADHIHRGRDARQFLCQRCVALNATKPVRR